MKKNFVITHHRLILENNPTRHKPPVTPLTNITILDIFKQLKNLGYENKDRMFKDNKFCGLIPIIEITSDRIDLKLCLSDKEADNQVVRDFTDIKQTRPLIRKENEGVDHTVHVVIKHNPQNPMSALFAIEYKTGLTPKFFVDTLNYLLRDMCKNHDKLFRGSHPTKRDSNNKPEFVKLNLKFSYESVLSDEVIKAFEQGRVLDVVFNKPISNPAQYDNLGNFTPNKNTMHLDVTGKLIKQKSKTRESKIKDIKNAFQNLTNQHYDLKGTTFTIKFENAEGNVQTAKYDTQYNEFSLSKKTYAPESIRKKTVDNDDKLNIDLCDRMFRHIS